MYQSLRTIRSLSGCLLTNRCRDYQLDPFIKSIGGVHGPEIIFKIEPDRFCGNGAGGYAQVDSFCERRRSDEVAKLRGDYQSRCHQAGGGNSRMASNPTYQAYRLFQTRKRQLDWKLQGCSNRSVRSIWNRDCCSLNGRPGKPRLH